MDLNLVVLAGRIATEPDVRTFPTGATVIRYLVTVRAGEPRRRVDVIPVTLWDPDAEHVARAEDGGMRGRHVWVAGSVQRRFWSGEDGRTSRIEVVAHDVKVREDLGAESEDVHTQV
jgi:single-stranded DNA-binding protein